MSKQKSKWIDFGTGVGQVNSKVIPANYTPNNYTPSQVNGEGTDKLSAHLKGLDLAFGNVTDVLFYDASVLVNTEIGVVGIGYDSSHTEFMLPVNQTYDGTSNELEVYCNGAFWEPSIHYNYENSLIANSITTYVPIPNGSRIRFRKVQKKLNFYDVSILVTTEIGSSGSGYNAAHTEFTLPNDETYDGLTNKLLVMCNEATWENGVHFDYQELPNATKITTYVPISIGNRIRFRMIKV